MQNLRANGHEFQFHDDSFVHKDPFGRELLVSFQGWLRISVSPWTGNIRIKSPRGKVSLSALSQEQKRDFLLELFRRWRAVNPESAKKAAFDYVDGQRGFVAVAFVVSLLFSLPLSAALFSDSLNQFTCTRELRENAVVGSMQVTKYKRKRKGHYILDLEFVAPDGSRFQGKDQLITQDETTIPKEVPVVFSANKPECWSLTPNLSGTEVNWAKRRYFAAFTFLFGSFFFLSGLLGVAWSLARWRRKRPFTDEVKALFHLN